jgi:histidine triad (HIT) family protein
VPTCMFCNVANHRAPARILFEDDQIVAFHDICPQAPTHLLVIPRKHLSSLHDANPDDADLLGKLLLAAQRAAAECGIVSGGYRVVINTGRGAGQSVFHLHAHVLGGRSMHWPPG